MTGGNWGRTNDPDTETWLFFLLGGGGISGFWFLVFLVYFVVCFLFLFFLGGLQGIFGFVSWGLVLFPGLPRKNIGLRFWAFFWDHWSRV